MTTHRDMLRRARAVALLAPGVAAPSPCVSVCRMALGGTGSSSDLCEGCLRTLHEIGTWGGMDDVARRQVWRQIAVRAAAWEDV